MSMMLCPVLSVVCVVFLSCVVKPKIISHSVDNKVPTVRPSILISGDIYGGILLPPKFAQFISLVVYNEKTFLILLKSFS